MTDLYRGHDAKYWHGRFVQATNAGLEFMLMLWEKDPELKRDVLAELNYTRPGLCESVVDALAGRPRPQSVEYWGDED